MNELSERFKILRESGRALIAFNVQNVNQLKILSIVSTTMGSPVMAQISKKYVDFLDGQIGLKNIVQKYQNDMVTFHLDHCMDLSIIKRCLEAGFKSVMYDGSSLSLEDNIKYTNIAYKMAREYGALLEAELGTIQGVEDGVGSEEGLYYSKKELQRFADEAKFDLLALAIGNAHGEYSSFENINMDLLSDAEKLIGQQLFVLHGGTGMTDEMIKKAISFGVVKLNVSTALKLATYESMKDYLDTNTMYNEDNFFLGLKKNLSSLYSQYIKKFTS
ncbi:MAG: class II fructose-bisphosphate aldolase [Cyclobacteriaceae bacterium]